MDKVISSGITRSFNKPNDELYELLKVEIAKPKPPLCTKLNSCDFQPRNDKQYIPKKRSTRQKVKTVRDIRTVFEKGILNDLPTELEKQQNYLLRKIKRGSLREDKTKLLAKKMLVSDKPVTKASWQMLMNINPEEHTHPMQYVLWNGKSIRINGSKGGQQKFICKYDLGRNKKTLKKRTLLKNKTYNKKKGLLQNSLAIDFKPGPLTCKKILDNSYQKYHVGQIDVVNLPKPGLEIQPLYGSALEPTISSFVNNLRDKSGAITQKWAEFAVAVLGTVDGPNVRQIEHGSSVTFDLNYKHDQTRLLMRRDVESTCKNERFETDIEYSKRKTDESDILPELQLIMERILDAVEINVMQDDMYKDDDEVREECRIEPIQNNNKEKSKKKYGELDRLDVTVIRLNEKESNEGDHKITCNKSHCVLGCICDSLQSTVKLKGHCGLVECMFECKCDFSKYSIVDALDSDCAELLPSLFNLNNEINCTLSKEEQKFHQTVIVSGDKSILLKAKKRNCKSSKKYEDYYNNLGSKSKSKVQRVLTIIEPKLSCENIEPWCMVHNLYKCFCKGRFTETAANDNMINDINKKSTEMCADNIRNEGEKRKELLDSSQKVLKNTDVSYRLRQVRNNPVDYNKDIYEIDSEDETVSCARINPYEGRKYSDGYYVFANKKIQELEINDNKLRSRLQILIDTCCGTIEQDLNSSVEVHYNSKQAEKAPDKEEMQNSLILESDSDVAPSIPNLITVLDETSAKKRIINKKPKLVSWLESSYKDYKRRLHLGLVKNTLERPTRGKVALYRWDFILERYSERKNLFLVTKQAPYRIFMAISSDNPLFENCINIDDIRFADLNKYPTTVKNLLTNTNDMKDYFCILYGYNHCWEFIGTVKKLSDEKDDEEDEDVEDDTSEESGNLKFQPLSKILNPNLLLDLDTENAQVASTKQKPSPVPDNIPKQSRWFIMTIENDFSEIQFYNKGFFVKYSSIIKAIYVARMSKKTVRLSSQKSADVKSDETQFGIYAIPNANEYCVFIGPYELNEPLGVETVKTVSDVGKRKRTRGVWITTDKLDNLKVIDNPLSFIPSKQEYNDLVTIENGASNDTLMDSTNNTPTAEEIIQINPTTSTNNTSTEEVLQINPTTSTNQNQKVVKPIKIKKSNGFYHLGSDPRIVKAVSVLKSPTKQIGVPIKPTQTFILNPSKSITDLSAIPIVTDAPSVVLSNSGSHPLTSLLLPTSSATKVNRIQTRPVAEVAPQIKIAAVYSALDPEINLKKKKKEGGMFVLKPEEINRTLVIDGNKSPKAGSSKHVDETDQISMDIEQFLDTSTVCTAPENEAFVISDDEDISTNKDDDDVKDIFIECTNVENLGALRGEIHKTKGVRFDFPGFNISEYYTHEDVFAKINQVLSRRVYIPRSLNLEWRIVNSMSQLKTQRLLKKESFGANLIMTPFGIKKRGEIESKTYENVKTYSSINNGPTKKRRLKAPQKTDKTKGHQFNVISDEDKSIKIISGQENTTCEQDNTTCDQDNATCDQDNTTLNQVTLFVDQINSPTQKSPVLDTEANELIYETVVINKTDILKSIANASETDKAEFTNVLKHLEIMSNVKH